MVKFSRGKSSWSKKFNWKLRKNCFSPFPIHSYRRQICTKQYIHFCLIFWKGICEPMWTEGCRRRNNWLKPYCSPDTHCISRPGQVASGIILIYRPQGKVIFSEASVCSRWGGGCLPSGGIGVCLQGDGCMPPRWTAHPRYWHLLATTAAVSMHPTGMHSSWKLINKLYIILICDMA